MLAWPVAAAGCALIAGVDGDYAVGNVDASTGGHTGSGAGMVGPGPGSGAAGGSGPGPSAGGASATGPGSGGVGGAGPGSGGGGSPPTFQVPCFDNGTLCPVGEVCCVTINSSDNTQTGCAQPGGCALQQFEVSCDGPEDCQNGAYCCGTHLPGLYWTAMQCDATCSASDQYVMCGGPMSGSQLCPLGGATCNASSDMQGYFFCT